MGVKKKSPDNALGRERERARVLYVDDEATLARLAARQLERLGFEVVTATSGEEALEAFDADADGFDVVVSDISMAAMSGVELAREVHQRRADLPIVLITGFDAHLEEAEARALNVRVVLTKPFRVAELATMIREEVDRREAG